MKTSKEAKNQPDPAWVPITAQNVWMDKHFVKLHSNPIRFFE